MSHLKNVRTLGYITISLIMCFADCNLIRILYRGRSCFLEIQIFRFQSKTLKYLSNFLQDNSLERKPHTVTIGSKLFHKRLNGYEKFYVNCKSLCSSHVYVQPFISDGYLETELKLLRYTRLHLITTKCLRSLTTSDFTTTKIFVRSLGCRTKQSGKFSNSYAILSQAFTYHGVFYKNYPLFRGSKSIQLLFSLMYSLHTQTATIGPIRKFKENTNSDGDTDQTIAEIVMDNLNISVQTAMGNIFTKFSEMHDKERDVVFNVFREKFFSRIIQEQIVYCPKQQNDQQTNHLPLLFLFEPFYTYASIGIVIILITSALYLNIIAGQQSSIRKQIKMFIHTLFIVLQALIGQDRVKGTKSALLLLLGVVAIMLISTYKDLLAVRLIAPIKTLEPSFTNLTVLKEGNYHILCSHSLSKMHYPKKQKYAQDEFVFDWDPMRLYCPYDCLLSKFTLSNLLSIYENSSLKNVGVYVRGKGDMYNGTSFEINNFLKRKTNCRSLQNTLSYDYSFIVYNNLGYLKAIFKTRLLQESGVTRFVERMEMYKKYEINNWNSIKRRPKRSHPKYSEMFRLARKHICPIFVVLVVVLSVDFIAVLIEVYFFRWKILNIAIPRTVNGCFRIYSYVFATKTKQDKYIKKQSLY